MPIMLILVVLFALGSLVWWAAKLYLAVLAVVILVCIAAAVLIPLAIVRASQLIRKNRAAGRPWYATVREGDR
jgi:predicted MFS family arabinose efflux permease